MSTPFDVTDKVVWITGASRGIGEGIARGLAANGARLVLQARSGDALHTIKKDIEHEGGRAEIVVGSVTDPEVAEACVQAAVARFGRLDGLVNNAGISPVLVRSEQLSLADWTNIIDINLTGAFIAATAAGRVMLEAGSGSIVNVSSIHGAVAAPRLAAYAASKGGIDMLTRTLAVEWAPQGVRVNAVAPGYVETSMTAGMRGHEKSRDRLLNQIPLGAFATPADLEGAVQYLLSDAARYLIGSIITIDGGWAAQ
ncbi:SDR family NAD(P)-dependent oxidoreductase [Nakamurella leprariae]|uniref:Glucose 1-dehydrogenase n=1 Tax=Nakamurella leprariae TaxID=2803911 RepID=A0A938YEG7_9ACTN|nr:glucose 1-dehydrogenase [Nakamurella leprariae]MBM9468349.1 glucose 1-dehydrogenase [Nakamurella leprariae]